MARPGLDKHPKFKRIVQMLGEPRPHALGYLEMLWASAYECGNPVIGDAATIEAVAEYPGKSGELFEALLSCGGQGRPGFIEEVNGLPGIYQIHDLFDHAPDYVKKRRQREREREDKSSDMDDGHRPTTADNGGQQQPSAENGQPPAPGTRTRTRTRSLNTGSGRTGAFSKLTEDDLRDDDRLMEWIAECSSKANPVISNSEADGINVFAAAERALEHGDNPVALFANLVGKGKWELLTQDQEDRARRRLKKYFAVNGHSEFAGPTITCLEAANGSAR